MKIDAYYRDVLVPANVAVSQLRRAGLPVSLDRVHAIRNEWLVELKELEKFVEGEAAKVGHVLKYSDKHAVPTEALANFLYRGLGLECYGYTDATPTHPDGQPSTADEDLSVYASLKVPREDDHLIVKAVIQIRSLSKGVSTYLDSFERTRRADGCCHPHFNWALRTSRLSAENPPVHQIPERSDKRVADAIKSIFVPRMAPAPSPQEWDPRKHGSCFRWDISGAEACVRAAMFTKLYCSRPDPVAYDYLRLGKDIHSKTASLIYDVPEGTYKKGSYERDAVGKTTFFAKQFGAKWTTVQGQIWAKARYWLENEQAKSISFNFDKGYPGLIELYLIDQEMLGQRGYCEDAYGRRRKIDLPSGVRYLGDGNWDCPKQIRWQLEHCFHIAANTPTQGTNASDSLFMLSLCQNGEYVPLQVPPMWQNEPIPFPEASTWCLNGGPGPGGKPMQSWHTNTVHDSGWGDCGPCYVEPTAKVVWRRCRAVPLDLRIEADVPYRVDLSVGPNMSDLRSYKDVAKQFGLEPMPER